MGSSFAKWYVLQAAFPCFPKRTQEEMIARLGYGFARFRWAWRNVRFHLPRSGLVQEPLFRVPDYAGLPWRVVVLGWWLLLRIYVGFANHSA